MDSKSRDPWHGEGAAIDFTDSDYEVADAAELPDELADHEAVAATDANFDDEF